MLFGLSMLYSGFTGRNGLGSKLIIQKGLNE